MSETLQDNIPEKTLKQGGAEEQEGEGDEEPKGAEEVKEIKVKKMKEDKGATFLEDEEEKLKELFQNTTEEIENLPEKNKF